MAFGKRNSVNLDILSYNIMLLGVAGSGKTSLINNVVTKYTGNPESVLFMEIGNERGADAIENINYINCPEWDMEYDELDNAAGFMTVIDDICENKTTEYKHTRAVVFDTIDQLIDITEAEVVRHWNRECKKAGKTDKVAKSINGCYGGYGRGEKVAIQEILDVINRLRRVGVATIIIGHVKTKQVDDVFSGESYQILTSDQQQNYFNAIKKNLHILGLLYIDRTIEKEKTGKKVFGTNKDEVIGHVVGETRKIRFRDNGAVVDCKSRFSDIVDEIECDADEFIKAITDAIKSEQSKSGKSFEEAEKEQKKLEKKQAAKIAKAEAEANDKKQVDVAVEQIVEWVVENKSNVDAIKSVIAKVKELGYSNPKEIDKLDDAKVILEMIL